MKIIKLTIIAVRIIKIVAIIIMIPVTIVTITTTIFYYAFGTFEIYSYNTALINKLILKWISKPFNLV